jgi:succinate dehydrogenase flavin-adding protein (antitoxin of CptAB toxin-antitoxin module)
MDRVRFTELNRTATDDSLRELFRDLLRALDAQLFELITALPAD